MDSVDSSTRADQTLTLLSTAPDHDAMHTHCLTTEQAPQLISTWHAANYLQRKATSSWSHRQSAALEQHVWQSVYQGRHVWVRHQHCHHRPTKVAWRPEACMNLSGQHYLKHPRSEGSLSLATIRRVAWKSASARMPGWNAGCTHCVLAMGGSALRTELTHLRRIFWTFLYSIQGVNLSNLNYADLVGLGFD